MNLIHHNRFSRLSSCLAQLAPLWSPFSSGEGFLRTPLVYDRLTISISSRSFLSCFLLLLSVIFTISIS